MTFSEWWQSADHDKDHNDGWHKAVAQAAWDAAYAEAVRRCVEEARTVAKVATCRKASKVAAGVAGRILENLSDPDVRDRV